MPPDATAAIATTTWPSSVPGYPPHVPTRMNVVTPRLISSSTTIEVVGVPMPVVWTETGTPSTVPVYPNRPRLALTWRVASRPPSNRAAIRVARFGSPGSRTTGA